MVGRSQLRIVDGDIARLFQKCGKQHVEHAYRRDMSAVNDKLQLRNLLCEISAAAAVACVADDAPSLRPSVGEKECDLRATIAKHTVWIELKHLEDKWLFDKARPPARGRAISMQSYLAGQRSGDRPGAEVLRSKLDGRTHGKPPSGVPEQLPEDGLGLLFLFHSGSPIAECCIRAALFGDGFLGLPDRSGLSVGLADLEYGLHYACNGLFALQRWQRVSACCWVRAPSVLPLFRSPFRLLRTWHNPLAKTPLPPDVALALEGTPTAEL